MPSAPATALAVASAMPCPISFISQHNNGLPSMAAPYRLTPTYVRTPSHACAMRKAMTTKFPNPAILDGTDEEISTLVPDILACYAHRPAGLPGKGNRSSKGTEALPQASHPRRRAEGAHDGGPEVGCEPVVE